MDFFDLSSQFDITTQPCSLHCTAAGFAFTKTSNDSGFPTTNNSNRTRRFMEKSNLRRALYPPFSPDLTSSDFFLFGYIKDKLHETEFMEKNNILTQIREILNGI
jgi:hypothetical protein